MVGQRFLNMVLIKILWEALKNTRLYLFIYLFAFLKKGSPSDSKVEPRLGTIDAWVSLYPPPKHCLKI